MEELRTTQLRHKIISECRKAIAAELKIASVKGNVSIRGSLREELNINIIKKVCKRRGFKHYEQIAEIMDICIPKSK